MKPRIPRPSIKKPKSAFVVEEPTPIMTRAIRSMIEDVVAEAPETPMWDEQNDAATRPAYFPIEAKAEQTRGLADEIEPEAPHEDTFGLLKIDVLDRSGPIEPLTTEVLIPRAPRISSIRELAKDLPETAPLLLVHRAGFADRGARTGRVQRPAPKGTSWFAKKWPVAGIFGASAVVLALAVATACTTRPAPSEVHVATAVAKPTPVSATPAAPARLAPASEAPKSENAIPEYRVEDLPVASDPHG